MMLNTRFNQNNINRICSETRCVICNVLSKDLVALATEVPFSSHSLNGVLKKTEWTEFLPAAP